MPCGGVAIMQDVYQFIHVDKNEFIKWVVKHVDFVKGIIWQDNPLYIVFQNKRSKNYILFASEWKLFFGRPSGKGKSQEMEMAVVKSAKKFFFIPAWQIDNEVMGQMF